MFDQNNADRPEDEDAGLTVVGDNNKNNTTSTATHRHHPWRSCWCIDINSEKYEHRGLLFQDRRLETAYLSKTKHSKVSKVALPVVLCVVIFACLAFFLLNKASTTDYDSHLQYSLAICIASFIVSLIPLVLRKCCEQFEYQIRSLALFLCSICFGVTFPPMVAVGLMLEYKSIYYAVFYTSSICNDSIANLTPAIDEVSNVGRAYFSSAMSSLTIAWVLQKVTVILDVVSARVVQLVVLLNILVLLVLGCFVYLEFFWVASKEPLFYNGTNLPFECASSSVTGAASLFVTLLLETLAASGALVWIVTQRARVTRDLFFWTSQLKLDVQKLEDEADPFRPDNLKRWLTSAKHSATAMRPRKQSPTAAATAKWCKW